MLVQALQTVYDKNTRSDIRQQAQAVLDQFANQPRTSLDGLMLYVMASRGNQPDYVRMYSLSAALRSLTTHWKDLAQPDQERVKEAALEILWEGLQDQEAIFIKTKLASILVELAKRSWPQQWPNFLNALEKAAAKSITRAELVLSVLRELTEDCTNSDFNASLSTERRSDIMQGLRGSLEDLLQMIFRLLESAHAGARDAVGQGNVAVLDSNLALAKAGLGALELLADLAPVQSLISHNLVGAVKAFAQSIPGVPEGDGSRQVQKAAWLCITSLAQKSTSDRNTSVDMLGFACSMTNVVAGSFKLAPLRGLVSTQRECASLDAIWPLYSLPNDDSTDQVESALLDMEEVHVALAQAVTQMTNQYFAQLLSEADANRAGDGPRAREALANLLQMLMQLLCQPSVRVRSASINGWLFLSRTWQSEEEKRAPSVSTPEGCALLERQIVLIWRCLADHILTLGAPDSPSSPLWPAAAFALEAYDDHSDFIAAMDATRAQTLLVMQALTKLSPVNALRFLRLRIALVRSPPSSPPDDASLGQGVRALHVELDDSRFFSNDDSFPEGVELESPRQAYVTGSLVWLVDGIVRDVANDIFAQFGQLNQLGQQANNTSAGQAAIELRLVLEEVLSFNERAVGDALGVLHVLSRLSKCYGSTPDGPSTFLFPVLNKMFSCATFHKPNEQGDVPYSADTLSIRKRAGSALLEICTQLAEGNASSPEIRAHMASLLPAFCENVLNVLNASGARIENQEKIVLHEVLVVVSNTLPSGEEQDRFIGELVAQPLRTWTSPEMTQIGSSPENLAAALRRCERDQTLQEGRRSLSLLLAMARRTKGRTGYVRPFARYWADILPNMFNFVRSLHALSRERAKYQDLLFVHPDEMRVMMGKFGGTNTTWPDSANNIYVLHALNQLREVLYSGIGRAARYQMVGAFGFPQAKELLSEVLLSNLEYLENRFIYRLIQGLVVPCIMSCPTDFIDPFLLPVMQRFVSHLFMRLDRSWPLLRGEQPRQQLDGRHWHSTLDITIDFTTESSDGSPSGQSRPVCSSHECGACPRCQQTDIFRDITIRSLSTGLVDILGVLLKTEPNKPTEDPRKVIASDIACRVLDNDAVAAPILLSLAGCLGSTHAACCSRAATVLRQIFYACLVPRQRLHRFVANELFCACFGALFRPRTLVVESAAQVILQVLTNTWVLAGAPGGKMPDEFQETSFDYGREYLQSVHQHLFAGVPNLQQEHIQHTEAAMAKATTDKTRRQRCKDFVWKCIFEIQPESMRPLPSQNPFNSKTHGKAEIEGLSNQNDNEMSGDATGWQRAERKMNEQHAFFDRASQWVNASDANDMGVQSLFS